MKPFLAVGAFIISGCSSVTLMDGSESPLQNTGACNVTVYQTRAQATKRGEIEELCIISGSSSGSFNHSVSTAIEKHKSKACSCGASAVYVESRREATLDVATVTLVAFRYLAK